MIKVGWFTVNSLLKTLIEEHMQIWVGCVLRTFWSQEHNFRLNKVWHGLCSFNSWLSICAPITNTHMVNCKHNPRRLAQNICIQSRCLLCLWLCKSEPVMVLHHTWQFLTSIWMATRFGKVLEHSISKKACSIQEMEGYIHEEGLIYFMYLRMTWTWNCVVNWSVSVLMILPFTSVKAGSLLRQVHWVADNVEQDGDSRNPAQNIFLSASQVCVVKLEF